ncbi:MAG: hypothetical protein ACREJM_15340 [Candidatus Saccharimonadales bacterium]
MNKPEHESDTTANNLIRADEIDIDEAEAALDEEPNDPARIAREEREITEGLNGDLQCDAQQLLAQKRTTRAERVVENRRNEMAQSNASIESGVDAERAAEVEKKQIKKSD